MDDIVSPGIPQGKPHYTYVLKYPLDYPDIEKAGTVFYVGKGTEKRKGHDRIEEHEREARRGVKSHKCSVIRKIWNVGKQVIREKLAYFETHEEALRYEISLIFFMRGYGHLTNLTDGGDGTSGLERSEEYRRKLSVATSNYMKIHNPHKGRKRPPETGRKISEALKGRSGRPLSKEHKQKLLEANKKRTHAPMSEEQKRKISNAKRGKPGRPMTEEIRRKLIEANKGRIHSEETRRKLSEARKGKPGWNKGIPATEEHRRKLRESQKGKKRQPRSEETKRKISAAHKGKLMHPVTDEMRRKLSEAGKGRVVSEETRLKLSKVRKGKKGRTPWNKGMPMAEEQRAKLRAAWERRRARTSQTSPQATLQQGRLFP